MHPPINIIIKVMMHQHSAFSIRISWLTRTHSRMVIGSIEMDMFLNSINTHGTDSDMGLRQIYWLPEQDGELFDASRVGGQRAEMKSMMVPNVQAASAHSSSLLLLNS